MFSESGLEGADRGLRIGLTPVPGLLLGIALGPPRGLSLGWRPAEGWGLALGGGPAVDLPKDPANSSMVEEKRSDNASASA